MAAGLVNGWLVMRLGMAPFIATLGTLAVFRGLTLVVTSAQSVNFLQGFGSLINAQFSACRSQWRPWR